MKPEILYINQLSKTKTNMHATRQIQEICSTLKLQCNVTFPDLNQNNQQQQSRLNQFMICSNNLMFYSLIACFVVLDAVSQSQDLTPLLLEYPHFVAKHLSDMTANLSLLLFPEKINIIVVLSFDMKICSLTNGLNLSD